MGRTVALLSLAMTSVSVSGEAQRSPMNAPEHTIDKDGKMYLHLLPPLLLLLLRHEVFMGF